MEQSMSEDKNYEKFIVRKTVDDYWRAEEKLQFLPPKEIMGKVVNLFGEKT